MISTNDEALMDDLKTEIEEETHPSLTYRMDFENKVIIGRCDGQEAMKQAITKSLNTELYQDIIYEAYGIETQDLIGKDTDYVIAELEDRIAECLLDDDRIEEISEFEFEVKKNKVIVAFIATTTEGILNIEGVNIGV